LARTVTAILIALALLAAACGDEDNPASKAFGGLSESDQQELEEWFTAMEDFPHVNARFARMLQEENAAGAQAAVDDMTGILNKGESIAGGFESGELKSTTEEYVSTMQNLAGSYETLLQVARRDPSGKGEATKEVLADLKADIRKAQGADARFAGKLRSAMSPEQRREFSDKMANLRQQLQEEATP